MQGFGFTSSGFGVRDFYVFIVFQVGRAGRAGRVGRVGRVLHYYRSKEYPKPLSSQNPRNPKPYIALNPKP